MELLAIVPPGAHLVRIEVSIDSQRVAVLETPPYWLTWNAGEEFQPHKLLARAYDSAGREATATLETPPLRIGQRESVSLVTLYLNLFDDRERPVTDLLRLEFHVFEDSVPQEISQFTAARQPLSVALLVDSSNSMGTGQRMEIARRSALEFVKRMEPSDRAMVMSFDDSVKELQPLTANHKSLASAIEHITPAGGTALYDSLVRAAGRLKELEGRKAIILLSDGRDQAFRENAPGSLHLFEEAVDEVVRSEAVVYAIGLGARLQDESDLAQSRSLREILETFTQRTGGRFYNPERPGQLGGIYEQIAEDLGRQYSLSYSPSNQTRDGKWRSVRVKVDRPGVRVLTRTGYYAPAR
ncbi:MAG TPA: VWA domain-containing protein [Candidatus Polarisedimenticolia bacterium]|nr:VWA domain-containing protein [Candidatus Polarisedimenticolia bacterium]